MSTDDAKLDTGSRADSRPAGPGRSSPGMELYISRYPSPSQTRDSGAETSNMAMLAIRAPPSLPASKDMMVWEQRRPLELPTRTVPEQDRIELPAIHQAVPEIHFRQRAGGDDGERRPGSRPYSPVARHAVPMSAIEAPTVSPFMQHKRRRLSDEDILEERERSVPRLFKNLRMRPLQKSQSVTSSPTITPCQRPSGLSDVWKTPARTTAYAPQQANPSNASPPPTLSTPTSRADFRPTLPSLPSLTLNSDIPQASRSRNWVEYALDSPRSAAPTFGRTPSSFDQLPSSFQGPSTPYAYQPPRGHPHPGHSPYALPHERTPFSVNHTSYLSQCPYGMDMNEIGSDGKQRKRRGNLPKETTDKLRSWFMAHLHHPYPTEDEKQELMGKTGLQMNQISNWFINARRRQLPAMINNARTESKAARSGRGGDSNSGRLGSPGDRPSPEESDLDASPVEDLDRLRNSQWPRMPSRDSF